MQIYISHSFLPSIVAIAETKLNVAWMGFLLDWIVDVVGLGRTGPLYRTCKFLHLHNLSVAVSYWCYDFLPLDTKWHNNAAGLNERVSRSGRTYIAYGREQFMKPEIHSIASIARAKWTGIDFIHSINRIIIANIMFLIISLRIIRPPTTSTSTVIARQNWTQCARTVVWLLALFSLCVRMLSRAVCQCAGVVLKLT